MRASFVSALLFAVGAIAVPTVQVVKRQSATTCGDNYYSADQVNQAFQAGYSDYENGQQYGSDEYPHQYKDYEGFSFNGVPGPYQEFPILESGVYTGGEPGADRVVFNENGEYAGAITHTGASSYDGFVGCSGTS